MKIKEIITLLENQGDWVNRRFTRDHLLIGNDNTDIDKIMICWVPTYDIIQKAIDENYHFIICHENPFYLSSTNMHTAIIEGQNIKKQQLINHDITIYRCHDLWDVYPKYGVLDKWSETLHLSQDSDQKGFYRYYKNLNITTKELALHIKKHIALHGENGIEVIGNLDKNINTLVIGTGAITDVFQMADLGADACLVSDDGINNWVHTQWCMDHNIPLIVINHRTAENAGMVGLKDYLTSVLDNIDIKVFNNEYIIHHL